MENFELKVAADLAQIALTLAVNKIDQKITLIREFGDSFRRLQRRLDRLHSYLIDADRNGGRQEKSNLLHKNLLRDLKSVALEAEDVIDLCFVKGLAPIASSSRPCTWASCFNDLLAACFGRVQSIACIPATYDIAVQINGVEKMLDEIEVSFRTFLKPSTNSISSNSPDFPKKGFQLPRSSAAVDVIPKRQEIKSLIDKHRVVAVVGMGGSGKTHLLRHVFRSIKSEYHVYIWLSVSRTFTVKQLQLNVLAKLRVQLQDASVVRRLEPQGEGEDIIQEEIHDALENQKYLIVFDDVWELQCNEKPYYQSVMEKLSLVGLPENDLRTVLVSTRNHEVASYMGAHVYTMPLLSDEHSKELFVKHLFPHSQSQVEQLQVDGNVEVAIDTAVKHCRGLPLAIIALAGLLKHQNRDEWAKSVQYISSSSSFTDSQENVVTTALMLSFDYLDHKAKPCFVMLGLFAEDEEIDAENLICMWLAQGHVTSHEEGTLMLNGLCNRCLLEMKKSDDYYSSDVGGYSTVVFQKTVITIHDLVHELAVRLCKDDGGICKVLQNTEAGLQQDLLSRKISKISLSKAGFSCIRDTVAFPSSLRMLRLDQNWNLSEVPSSLAAAVALRTLDIRGTCIASLPKCIGNLLLLQYLDIRDSPIKRFPECLRNLKLLKYLYTSISHHVPQWIGDLEQLAFFEAESAQWTNIDRIPEYLKCVRGVRIDVGIHDDDDDNDNEGDRRRQEEGPRRRRSWRWDSLSKLTQLEFLDHLKIYGFKKGCIPPPNIVNLTLSREHYNPALTLSNEWQCCLQKLQYLSMTWIQFPDELHGFQNLSRLLLVESGVYPKVISDLPRLETLWLLHDNVCESFPEEYGKPGAFPKLRTLFISGFGKLKKMPKIETGGMPCLSELHINNCFHLSEGCGWTEKAATLSRLSLFLINGEFKAELEAARKGSEQSSSIIEDRRGQ